MRVKRFALILAFVAFLVAPLTLSAAEESWKGWITDSACGAKAADAEHADCARKCAEGGAKLVLYVKETQKLYHLSDQAAALANLGHAVVVTGALEGDAIKVTKIAKAEG